MKLKIAAVQDSPVFLDRRATTQRMLMWIEEAAMQGVDVLAFGETFLPGYPFWLSSTGGAAFNDPVQKECYRLYLDAAVRLDGPELAELTAAARARGIFLIFGMVERGMGPASGSVYCSAMVIDPERGMAAPHRKLMPTYEERLVWAQGDGHGLRAHQFRGVTITVLNCWENWQPLARYALYGQGSQLHVALWPGGVHNTHDSTRFIAKEGRLFVLSAGATLRPQDVSSDFPVWEHLPKCEYFNNGGSAIAAPDGRWLVEPVVGNVGLVAAEIDLHEVARERQNFDPTGHYSRPDVFDLCVDRRRLAAVRWTDESGT